MKSSILATSLNNTRTLGNIDHLLKKVKLNREYCQNRVQLEYRQLYLSKGGGILKKQTTFDMRSLKPDNLKIAYQRVVCHRFCSTKFVDKMKNSDNVLDRKFLKLFSPLNQREVK